ncbi:hypothetical protein M885DRAFT_616067 [Pelagophyceae sp. CCMP2097]|nr:hypothetical protein M885DRAFT_616067 [Pelagophyceae sp. CCMP2097]
MAESREAILKQLQAQSSGFAVESKGRHGSEASLPPEERKAIDRDEERPEDFIPDTPENAATREFLKNAPSKGLWMPMGQEVKVMMCWRCKAYGHRTGDRECPLYAVGNVVLDAERTVREDPMAVMLAQRRLKSAETGMPDVATLRTLVAGIKSEHKERKKRRKQAKQAKKLKKEIKSLKKKKKKRDKKRRKKDSDAAASSSSDSDSSSSSSDSDSD